MAGFETPELALEALEDAYRNEDIEAAVTSKNFYAEAVFMITKWTRPATSDEEKIAVAMAETLELAFRNDIKERGFPQFKGIACRVIAKEDGGQDHAIVTEECTRGSDGEMWTQRLHAFRSNDGWTIGEPEW